MRCYEAVFVHGRISPLYNGSTCLIIFARDEQYSLTTVADSRNLPDEVLDPGDPQVGEALTDMGYALSAGACGPCLIYEEAGWRALVRPIF